MSNDNASNTNVLNAVPILIQLNTTNPPLVVKVDEVTKGLTLADYVPGDPTQVWYVVFQPNWDGGVGFAFVSLAFKAPMSVTYNGHGNQLVVQTYEIGSIDKDAWLPTQTTIPNTKNTFRINFPDDLTYSWNDGNSCFKAGDKIVIFNNAESNSLWNLVPVSQTSTPGA